MQKNRLLPECSLESFEAKQGECLNPVVISVFNHKGGIGKTTSTYNFGYQLYKMGFRVLMIDADPQCNLTSTINPFVRNDPEEALADNQLCSKNFTENGERSRLDYVFRELLPSNNCDSMCIPQNTKETVSSHVKIQLVHNYGVSNDGSHPGLFFLPGYISFEALSSSISIGLSGLGMYKPIVRYPVTIFREVALFNQIDIVLLDLMPSVSSLNQSLIMYSDYLLVPFRSEVGCYDSVSNLTKVFSDWFNTMRAKNFLESDEGPLFMGSFLQLAYYEKNKKPLCAIAHQSWVKRIILKTYSLNLTFINFKKNQKILPFRVVCSNYGLPYMHVDFRSKQYFCYPFSDLDILPFYDQSSSTNESNTHLLNNKINFQSGCMALLGYFLSSLTDDHFSSLLKSNPRFFNLIYFFKNISPVVLNPLVKNISIDEIRNEVRLFFPDQPDICRLNFFSDSAILFSSFIFRCPDVITYVEYELDQVNFLLNKLFPNAKNSSFIPAVNCSSGADEKILTDAICPYFVKLLSPICSTPHLLFIPILVGKLPGSIKDTFNFWVLFIVELFLDRVTNIFCFNPMKKNYHNDINIALVDSCNSFLSSDLRSRLGVISLNNLNLIDFDFPGALVVEMAIHYSSSLLNAVSSELSVTPNPNRNMFFYDQKNIQEVLEKHASILRFFSSPISQSNKVELEKQSAERCIKKTDAQCNACLSTPKPNVSNENKSLSVDQVSPCLSRLMSVSDLYDFSSDNDSIPLMPRPRKKIKARKKNKVKYMKVDSSSTNFPISNKTNISSSTPTNEIGSLSNSHEFDRFYSLNGFYKKNNYDSSGNIRPNKIFKFYQFPLQSNSADVTESSLFHPNSSVCEPGINENNRIRIIKDKSIGRRNSKYKKKRKKRYKI